MDPVKPTPGTLELPEPRYAPLLRKSVLVPMRDGLKLSTDIYLPEGMDDQVPAILIRTIYSKKRLRIGAHEKLGAFITLMVGQGYAICLQDGRGRFESAAPHRISSGDKFDGYDTIEWIARQPWCTGRVGTYGCSHNGEMQLYSADTCPPSLKAMIPQSAGSAAGSAGGAYNLTHEPSGGAFPLTIFRWYVEWGSKLFWSRPDHIDDATFSKVADMFDPRPAIPDIDYDRLFRELPITSLPDRVPVPPMDFAEFVRRRYDVTDPWWDDFDFVAEGSVTGAPALFIDSWCDFAPGDTLYLRSMYERTGVDARARDNQFAIISPSDHCNSELLTADYSVGERHMGDARFGHLSIYLRWFNHWLKGDGTTPFAMPKVQYYVMGKNRWHASDVWPPAGASETRLFLGSRLGANSDAGDGCLTAAPLGDGRACDVYRYDPADPAPAIGEGFFAEGDFICDQRPLSRREDVLVYTTEPLPEELEIAGPIFADLSVSSSAPDTDFVVKLVEVRADGMPINIREGILRARFRNSRERAELMEPGHIYRLRVRLQDVAISIPAGHRLRVHVTSSSFPRWDRNLNTGGLNCDETDFVVAENRVHLTAEHPSTILFWRNP